MGLIIVHCSAIIVHLWWHWKSSFECNNNIFKAIFVWREIEWRTKNDQNKKVNENKGKHRIDESKKKKNKTETDVNDFHAVSHWSLSRTPHTMDTFWKLIYMQSCFVYKSTNYKQFQSSSLQLDEHETRAFFQQ